METIFLIPVYILCVLILYGILLTIAPNIERNYKKNREVKLD